MNDYYGYGCAFTLNSSKQFWARGTSKHGCNFVAKCGEYNLM